MVHTVDQTFSTLKAAKISGLSRAMLDYLCRSRVVTGSASRRGRGRPREYTFADLVILRLIGKLLASGVSASRMKGNLRKLHRDPALRRAIESTGWYLVTDGEEVFLHHGSDVVERIMDKGQYSFAFVVEVAKLQEGIARDKGYSGGRRRA